MSANRGKVHYTDGLTEICLSPGEVVPEGFRKGGLPKGVGRKPANAGKITMHNDSTNIYVSKDEIDKYLELGFVIGGKKLSDTALKSKKEKTKETYKNKSKEALEEEHSKRSQGASDMWSKRTEEENNEIRHRIGKSIWNNKSEEAKLQKVTLLKLGYDNWKNSLTEQEYSNLIIKISEANKEAWSRLSDTDRTERINKAKETILNKSDEDKLKSLLKLKDTLSRKPLEYWENKFEKSKLTIANYSEEKKELIHKNRQLASIKSALNRDKTDEQARRDKISSSERNRSKAEWDIINKKRIETNSKKSDEEKLEIVLKAKLTAKLNKSFAITKLEKRCELFLTNNNFNFVQHYFIKNNNLGHEFDFAVFDNYNNLILLIDCDGLYFHGFISDENGKQVNTYTDDYRSLVVPEGVKFHIIYEHHEEESYSLLLSIINIDYDSYLELIFLWCRKYTFPYPKYNDEILHRSYNLLINAKSELFSQQAKYGMKIVTNFHHSIYKCNVKNCTSMYDAWLNDEVLLKAIKNRVVYKGTDLDPSKVLAGLNMSKLAPKVSVFNPYLAKYLVEKYACKFTAVFDPFSGFSGRMLGACAAGKHYVGKDINNTTIQEATNILLYFNLDAELSCEDSFINENHEYYDCLLTCPPYNDKENWGQDIPNLSCDEWITKCLNKYICKMYIFVVDNTLVYKDYIVEEIINKSHFGSNSEMVVVINNENI